MKFPFNFTQQTHTDAIRVERFAWLSQCDYFDSWNETEEIQTIIDLNDKWPHLLLDFVPFSSTHHHPISVRIFLVFPFEFQRDFEAENYPRKKIFLCDFRGVGEWWKFFFSFWKYEIEWHRYLEEGENGCEEIKIEWADFNRVLDGIFY